MNIKEDMLYDIYISYIEYKKNNNEINNDESKLFKMSGYYFEGFKNQYNTNTNFRKKVDTYHLSKNRNIKINKIID